MENKRGYQALLAYQKSFDLAMKIFEISVSFPREEKYSLTDQIRRSSRSVCACIAESYGKRQYPKHFVMKLSDSAMENNETQTWLDFSLKCNYIAIETYQSLSEMNDEVGKLIFYMIRNPDKFTLLKKS